MFDNLFDRLKNIFFPKNDNIEDDYVIDTDGDQNNIQQNHENIPQAQENIPQTISSPVPDLRENPLPVENEQTLILPPPRNPPHILDYFNNIDYWPNLLIETFENNLALMQYIIPAVVTVGAVIYEDNNGGCG